MHEQVDKPFDVKHFPVNTTVSFIIVDTFLALLLINIWLQLTYSNLDVTLSVLKSLAYPLWPKFSLLIVVACRDPTSTSPFKLKT